MSYVMEPGVNSPPFRFLYLPIRVQMPQPAVSKIVSIKPMPAFTGASLRDAKLTVSKQRAFFKAPASSGGQVESLELVLLEAPDPGRGVSRAPALGTPSC